jgi:hypothetical protein
MDNLIEQVQIDEKKPIEVSKCSSLRDALQSSTPTQI